MRARRRALTLLELLVVIGIVGILIALLLPAVQRVRAAASRTQCANNLKQIGLALHLHHDTKKVFPSGVRWQKGKDAMLFSSWLAQILPYIEQQSLWDATVAAYRQSRNAANNPPHAGYATVVMLYVCPADGRGEQPQVAVRDNRMVALTSYLGVEGLDLTTRDGILFRDSRVRIADVSDGLSNTLLVGERPPSPDFQFGWWYAGAGQRFTGSCDMVLGVREQNVMRIAAGSCAPGTYSFAPGQLNNPCDIYHFWSLHSNGANFLFADGGVRFIAYSAAPLLPALASRAGGEPAQARRPHQTFSEFAPPVRISVRNAVSCAANLRLARRLFFAPANRAQN
jgi:prepilin-type processing-associated H-X9-DG protein/prepilin-type N-terminal cleavage/methylation domain-containing protein